MKFGKIIDGYDLPDDIAIPLIAELEDCHLVWWQKQASDWSKDNLVKSLQIKARDEKIATLKKKLKRYKPRNGEY